MGRLATVRFGLPVSQERTFGSRPSLRLSIPLTLFPKGGRRSPFFGASREPWVGADNAVAGLANGRARLIGPGH